MLHLLRFQEPAADASRVGAQDTGSAASWLWDFARTPGLLETVVGVLGFCALLVVWWRIARLGERVRNRSFLRDYFLGLEQALHGDAKGAEQRLERVLQKDPENHYARRLLGSVQSELGHPEKAHAQHLLLRDAFEVQGAENDVHLARALLAAGRPEEAAKAAHDALQSRPTDLATLEFAFRACLQANDPEAASEIATRMLPRILQWTDPMKRDALRQDAASAFAAAGARRLARGDAQGANAWLRKATAAAADADSTALLAARIEAAGSSVPAVATRLVDRARNAPGAEPGAWAKALLPMLPKGRWRCARCDGPLESSLGRCPRCHAEGHAVADEPRLFLPIEAPDRLADALEANAAHVRRVCAAAVDSELGSTAHASARTAVLELGARAVPELLERARQRGEAAERAVSLLRDLGPETTPVLFAAAQELEDARILPDGGALANAVGRVVQGFDRSALPHVRALFASAQKGNRKILIDYFLGLADMREFEFVLERFPPIEVLHRIARADAPTLRRFLAAVEPNSTVCDVLLAHPSFSREVDVLLAIPLAAHPAALESLLLRRGPSSALATALLEALSDTQLAPPAKRILAAFGRDAADPLLSALGDPDCEPHVRQAIQELLAQIGAPAVDRVCANFGTQPSEFDLALRATLVRMGDAGIESLATEYAHSGLMERMTIGMWSNDSHRRSQIALALAELGTDRAIHALSTLRAQEDDEALALRLDEALHRARARRAAGGGDGA